MRVQLALPILVAMMLGLGGCSRQEEVPGADPGRFTFEPTGEIVVGDPTVWEVRFEAGAAGIEAGGRLLFRFPHPYSFMAPLNWFPRPDAEGHIPVTATASSQVPVDIVASTRGWHDHAVEAVLPEGLGAGELLFLTIGTAAPDGPSLAPRYSSANFAPVLLADVTGDQRFVSVPTENSVAVRGGEPERVELIVGSQVRVGSPVSVTVRLRDSFGNIARPVGPLSVELWTESNPRERIDVSFLENGPGWVRVEGPVPSETGVVRIRGRSDLSGRMVLSNPVRVLEDEPEAMVFWADLHGHSQQSDGSGAAEAYYRFARGPAALDVAALSDHEWQLDADEWTEKQHLCRGYDEPFGFVPFLAWEYSLGGHRVVYAKDCAYLPPRAAFDGPKELWEIEYNHAQIHAWSRDGEGRPLRDWADSRQLLADHADMEALVVPHTSATWHMGNDWDTHDPKLTPLVEIYSAHGSSEAADSPKRVNLYVDRGSVRTALARGYRLGFLACGDSHDGKPGLTLSGPHSGGLTAVSAARLDRDAVWDALVGRRTWATTGARILVDVNVDGAEPGSVVRSTGDPKVSFEVHGTDIIESIEVIADGRVVHTQTPLTSDASGSFADQLFDGWSSYYVRVAQRDGHLAWSSPIWAASVGNPIVSELRANSVADGVRVRWNIDPGVGDGSLRLLRRRGNDGGMDLDRYQLVERFETREGSTEFVDRDAGGAGITTYYALVWSGAGDTERVAPILLGLVSVEVPAARPPDPSVHVIDYYLEEPGTVEIEIFNLKRQPVHRVEIEHLEPGPHQHFWDGRDLGGMPCAGLHLCVVTADGFATQRKPLRIGSEGGARLAARR